MIKLGRYEHLTYWLCKRRFIYYFMNESHKHIIETHKVAFPHDYITLRINENKGVCTLLILKRSIRYNCMTLKVFSGAYSQDFAQSLSFTMLSQ